jgi:hypothetical protein
MSRQHRKKSRGPLQGSSNNAARREVRSHYNDFTLAWLIDRHCRLQYLGEKLGGLRPLLDLAGDPDYSPERMINAVKFIFDTAFDYNRCMCSCKNMYFCTLPAGHDGEHNDDGFRWGPEDDDGYVDEIKTLVPEGL